MLERHGRKLALTGLCLVMLGGCDQLGSPVDVIQGKIKAPDEFEVVARKPLRIPNTQNLPEPRLGARSPLEPTPNADARAALLGGGGTPAPGVTSASEAALLGAANASAARGSEGAALQEKIAKAEANKPYETPSLFELIGDDGEVVEDVLDADAEAQRLQSEGIAPSPNNPNPETDVSEGVPLEPIEPAYPREGRRPNNQLGKDAQQPLFN